MTDTDLHRFLTPALLRETLQAAGYRVGEAKGADGVPVLSSATNGLGFELRLFNPLPDEDDGTPPGVARFADATFRTAFQVRGELPLALVNGWNATHRFARLQLAGGSGAPDGWLIFDMDVVGLGGVTSGNLRAHVEIWDRLLQELLAWLRAELPKLAKAAPVAEPAAEASAA
ncbi:YbjN domain-containing protein [Telmatospirillum siberiense]|uniref:YbjN domain-containing protein n=1 Tax=Telmatospirillum siberiense TaxID=382514 RepID=A0A2N3PWX4_9PROT|nr:YbjN domain-containing protein [Telmatospirillum siberiense]PKU24900.1 hypothetical protein CWS72_08450 [Telmatospirillum siberiense]